MTRQTLVLIVSTLTLVPYAVTAQEPASKKSAQPSPNQVYVKIIWPTAPAARDKDRPAVESWIAEQLKKGGQTKFTAATGWVLLDSSRFSATEVWDAKLDGQRWGCSVAGQIDERADGRIKVLLHGWNPGGARVTISLKDEPGSRGIAAVEETKLDEGLPYVAVLIGPQPENPAAPADHKMDKIEKGRRDYTHNDAGEVLKLVLTDWMTNPKVKDQPYGYLIDPDRTGKGPKPKLERLLIDQRYVPKGFDLKITGVKVELFDRSKQDLQKGEMCIRIDRFEMKKDGTIEIEFLHAGYGIIGGDFVTYSAKKEKGKWGVEFSSSFDP